MELPEWAPPALVDRIKWTERDIERFTTSPTVPSFFDDIPVSEGFSNFYQQWLKRDQNRSPEDDLIGPLQEKLLAYKRLATHEYMREAWSTLERQSSSVKAEDRKNIIDALLYVIEALLTRFPKLLAIAEPHTKKRNKLARLSKQLQNISNEIEDDVTASRRLRDFVPAYLGAQVLKHRCDAGEEIRDFDREYPQHLFDSDCGGLRLLVEVFPDDRKWNDRSSLERMTYWAVQAQNLSLTELMRTFADMLEWDADQKPIILQPWRGDSEKRPYLIRGISEFFQSCFQRPLDDAVALIVSAILDLDPVLTRDDVRPYLT